MEKSKMIRIKNDRVELDTIVAFVEELDELWNIGVKTACEINLMLEELFINSVSYAYVEGEQGAVEIKFTHSPGLLTIEYSDDGAAFDPLTIAAADTGADIMHRQIGGLGMHLIRKLSDCVEYKRSNNSNILIITKKINADQ